MLKEEKSVKNYEGAKAYTMTPELELYTAVVTASLSDTNYEKQDERVERISQLIGKVSPEFVARLAIYTRTVMNLRSIPLLLLVELAKIHNGDDLVARAVEKTVLRADEIMELLMCYQWRNVAQSGSNGNLLTMPSRSNVTERSPSHGPRKKLGRLSRQIQNGLQRAFNRFDEYQFAKYDRDNLEVRLRDALFLVHPKAKDEKQQALFDKIVNRSLETPYTWETELSALGQQHFESEEQKKDAFRYKWEELIDSRKLGYMSMMRNLRNMLQSDVSLPKMMDVASRLSDADQVARSRQLPFRYLSAYREIENVDSLHTTMLMNALESAVKCSAANIEGFDENTRVLLASDVSGSMWSTVSKNSTVRHFDIGILLSMLLRSRCKQVVAGIFGNDWKVVNMPSDNILMATRQLEKLGNTVGFSTNGYKVINWLSKNNMVMDKVMMFTDMQMWDSTASNQYIEKSWRQYKKTAPDAKLYLFDLVGYGQLPIRQMENDVYLIAGWSDRVFDVLSAIDKGEDALDVINKIDV
ncbi:MAG: TROVE domain-containing protein [Bacteroidales bacterium]|nr:TROVE domain-containing protein [Bacteroidales bacterium]